VERGIELLRDRRLRYNPDEVSIYRSWPGFFSTKWAKTSTTGICIIKQRQWAEKWRRFSARAEQILKT
jgi:hypothetical protein